MATRTLEIVLAGDPASASRAFRKVGDDAERMGKKVDREGGRIRGFATITSKGFGRVGLAAGGMATAAAGAATLMAKSFVEGATDISESLSKNEVLFGRFSGRVDRFSQDTAKSFGISRQAALEATGTFGNLFTALDLGPRKSAGMSIALTKLAADMASFNNASPEEALEAIRSGLVGETEPLRRFGVNINDAALRTEALRMGLVKTTKEALTPQQKALSVNALLFKQTASAQGDFARTSGGLANQQRILKAQLSDTGAELGGRLMPIALKAIKAFNSLFDSQSKGGRIVRNLANAYKDYLGIVRGVIDSAIGWVQRFARRNREDIQAVVQALRNLGRFFRNVFEDVIVPAVRKALPGIKAALEGTVQSIRGLIRIVTGLINGDWTRVWKGVKDIVRGGLKSSVAVIKTVGELLIDAMKGLGKLLIRGVVSGLKGLAGAVKNGVVSGFKAGINEAGKILDKLNPLSSITGNIVKDAGDAGSRIAGSIPGGASLGAGGGGDTGGLQIEARTGLGFLRRKFGGLTLSSGRRSPEENARVGGAPNSDHLTGLGTDIVPAEGWTFAGINRLDRIAAWARTSPLIRWIGWRGVKGHGPYNHLHLSWVDRMKGDVRAAAGMLGRHPKERVIGLGGGAAGDTVPQIRNLWTRAGGSASKANMAAAIAMAESAGDPHALNRNTNGSVDRGLWQINSVHGGLSTFDRLGNARAAVRISGNGRNWNPWVTFKSGAYRRFLTATGGGGGRSGGGVSAAEQAFIDSQDNASDRAAMAIRNARKAPRPVKGGRPTGPAKGIGEGFVPLVNATDGGTAGGGDDGSALAENTRALEEHTAALNAVTAEMERNRKLGESALASDNYQLKKYIADFFSGAFARGVVGRSMTPGTGVEVAYAMSIFQIV